MRSLALSKQPCHWRVFAFFVTFVTTASESFRVAAAMFAVVATLNASCTESLDSSDQSTTQIDAGRTPDTNDADTQAERKETVASKRFEVALTASALRVCGGECVALTAQVSGGIAPYAYSWNPGIGTGAGPHEVCPTHTRQYQVVVTDALATGGEFASDPVTDSIEIQYEPVCIDAAVVADAQAHEDVDVESVVDKDASTPEADVGPIALKELREGCRTQVKIMPLDYNPSNARPAVTHLYPSMLAFDDQDNFIVTTGFVGTLNLGGQLLDPKASTHGLLVIKYDANCNHVWSKSYGGFISWLRGASVATSGNEIVLASEFKASADFGKGVLINPTSLSNAALVKLDAQGNTLWSISFSAMADACFRDVAVDSAGNIVVTGLSYDSISLGGETLISSTGDPVSFVAKFSPDGTHLWSRIIPLPDLTPRVEIAEDDRIVVTDCNGGDGIVMAMDANGDEIWTLQHLRSDDIHYQDILGFNLNDQGVISWIYKIGGEIPIIDLHFSDIDTHADSNVTFTRPQQEFGFHALAVDQGGYTLEAGAFTETLDGTELQAVGSHDTFLLRYDQNGNVISYAAYGTSEIDWPFALAVDSQNRVVLAVVTHNSDLSSDLSFIRYAP